MWLHNLTELGRGFAQLIFPNACLICDAPENDGVDFRHGMCIQCFQAVSTDPLTSCSLCAATVGPHTNTGAGCVVCRSASFAFDAAIRLGPYAGQLREAVLRMKSPGGDGLSERMGEVLWEAAATRLRAEGIEIVIPIPLHWRRRWSRGHNQATAIARELAHGLQVPLTRGVLTRVRHTPQQVQPSATARRENVKGAFRSKSDARLARRTVLLVDDVMTTGSTASEAARTLRAAGAARVVVVVLARR